MEFKKGLLLFTVFLGFFVAHHCSAREVSMPVLINLQISRNIDSTGEFFLQAEADSNSEVMVYIDGTYAATAKCASKSEKSIFYFASDPLLSGEHTIFLIAKDKTSLVLSAPLEKKIVLPPLPAPVLFESTENTLKDELIIRGVYVSGTSIKIFADGKVIANQKRIENKTGAIGFIAKPIQYLSPGNHEIWAIAENIYGEKSENSNTLNIKIVEPTPPPILLGKSGSLIAGLVKNDLKIKLVVDGQYQDEIKIKNDKSGTANFSYKLELKRGIHLVSAVALDSTGKLSKKSNVITLNIYSPAIAEAAKEARPNKEVIVETNDIPVIDFSAPKEDVAQGENVQNNGLLDESEKKNNKLSPSMISFILFLVLIVGWIIFINKRIKINQEK